MKIAIFTDTFYPMVNGVVTAILNTARPLADRGHRIYIVTPKINKEDDFHYPGITIIRLSSLPATFYEDFRWTTVRSTSTYRKLRKEGVQLVHFMTPFTASYLGIKIGRLLKVPVIGTFHTFISDPAYYEHMFNKIWKPTEPVVWKYTNFYYNAADLVTAPSPSTLKSMHENGCHVEGKVISNGISPDIFDNTNWKEFKKTHNLGEKVILYFGRLAQEKNLLTVVRGFAKAWESDSELQLLLIGDGPQRKDVENIIKNQPYESNVMMLGSIPYSTLIKSGVFKAAKLFVSASKTENQPMTILESQVNGLVCIGANARGIPDLIEDGVNGLLFHPDKPEELADRITTITSNPDLYEKFKANTITHIKDHTVDAVSKTWEDLYSKMIEDYANGAYPIKDYLHLKKILSIAKDFKFDFSKKKKD
ncbi:glycosyltransferase [Spirochaeta cellobiosiphila]|uniref:glycosyltransferase n=1 Tax=Spirochaeta cellobiosiphila TaxID=504483 RepID=UPI0003FFA82A|nr:glycosyltransferase [Spirochaeta cellobiosiphila]